jgi:small subunit ribosomal protein S17e
MGSVKSVAIKSLGNRIIMEHGKMFSKDFEKNKAVLGEIKAVKSKKINNILAGYITKKMRQMEKTGM